MASVCPDPCPRTVEEIFQDYSLRHGGMYRALTSDAEAFYDRCDPENEYMCLYGDSDGSWRVDNALEVIPTVFPEPTLGLTVGRDLLKRSDWLALIALHSDCWLIAIAFRFAINLNYQERNQLFDLINQLPTLRNLLTLKEQNYVVDNNAIEIDVLDNNAIEIDVLDNNAIEIDIVDNNAIEIDVVDNNENENENENDAGRDDICASCEEKYEEGEFWIACDTCELWYHGNCVKVTEEKANRIKKFKCPICVYRSKKPKRD